MSELATSGEFSEALAQQGATLTFGLRTDEWRHTRFGQEKVWHPSVVDGIDLAGAQLRKYPDDPLIEPSLPIDTTRLPKDYLSQALGRMINASVLVPAFKRPTTDTPSFVSEGTRWDTCAEAEPGFLWSSMAIRNFNIFGPGKATKQDMPGNVKIFTDGTGTPLFMQKAYGNPSSLLLSEVAIDGVPYPAGSIVALSFSSNPKASVALGSLWFMPSNKISGVDFLRLSSLTVPSNQRPEYDPSRYKLTAQEARAIKDLSIERIVKSAARAVRLVKAGAGVSAGASETAIESL